jgi:hypothetical protein
LKKYKKKTGIGRDYLEDIKNLKEKIDFIFTMI